MSSSYTKKNGEIRTYISPGTEKYSIKHDCLTIAETKVAVEAILKLRSEV